MKWKNMKEINYTENNESDNVIWEHTIPVRKGLSGSTAVKILAYFLLAVSVLVGCIAVGFTIFMASEDVYSYGDSALGRRAWVEEAMYDPAMEEMRDFYYLRWPVDEKEVASLLDEFCEEKNIRMEVYKQYPERGDKTVLIAGNYEGFGTHYRYERRFVEYELTEKKVGKEIQQIEEPVFYNLSLYVKPDFAYFDRVQVAASRAVQIWELRYVFATTSLICGLSFIILFVFLMYGAGHKNGKPGIVPGVLTPIHFDVLTAFFGIVACLGMIIVEDCTYSLEEKSVYLLFSLLVTAEAVWCTLYCAETALRFKLGHWWKHTLIYVVLHLMGKGLRTLGRGAVYLLKGLPLVINAVLLFLGIGIFEFILLVAWGAEDFPLVWLLEKIILLPAVLYLALICKKLQEGSCELAEGNLNYQLDTSKMVLDFKEHGENLNRIGHGISKAVEERMKSEHLKTELITNVSHDIKTPLTSIINYADLLGTAVGKDEQVSREKVAEYSEVLLRQSKRLKKLLEDLVEASKATTGNLDVNMERCEVGVLLSQAVGEYEQRFWEKQLEVIVREPGSAVTIMADGRRLWRVFDNLLNNICKYAQENSRVYLTVELRDGQAEIIFRNMSKYPLDLTGEELEERFVRGDKSRHMEGNGLGLSIAKSLVELQNGKLEIVTDGDLFKVSLRFAVAE